MLILVIILIVTAIYFLYLKYRVVVTGEKCKDKVIGLASQNAGYVIGGVAVKKNAYILKIGHKKYQTAYGCIFSSLEKRNIGKEMLFSTVSGKKCTYPTAVPCFFRLSIER